MFDTIRLEILGRYILRHVNLVFKFIASTASFRKRVFNPDKNFIFLHGYFPRITFYEYLVNGQWIVRKFEVECSVRKLFHNTSYFGVSETDVDEIIAKMITCLAVCGLDCTATDIESGNVLTIAYPFNFYLPTEFARPQEFILPMVYLDVGKRTGNVVEKMWLQVLPGYGIKWYNGFRGIGAYDKGAELENNERHTKKDLELIEAKKAGLIPSCFEIENTLQNREAVKRGIAIFYDGDIKKERHIREVLKDHIALKYLRNVFVRLADPCNVKALEKSIFPIECYHEKMIPTGISFQQAQLLFAHAVTVQQLGSLRLKEIADSYSKYGRQYRQNYYDQLSTITSKLKGLKLSGFFDYCKQQLNNPKIYRSEADFDPIPPTPPDPSPAKLLAT